MLRLSRSATIAAAPIGDLAAACRPILPALPLLRFGLVNMTALAIVGAAYQQGWVTAALAADTSRMGLLIVALFLVGVALAAQRAVAVSRDLDAVGAGRLLPGCDVGRYLRGLSGAERGARVALEAALRLRLASRIAIVRNIASSLVLLGLIGTVLGFIIALGGVDARSASDVTRVATMVAALVEGMGIALYTTLLGAVLNVWLMTNYRLLESATVTLLAALIERGASDARA